MIPDQGDNPTGTPEDCAHCGFCSRCMTREELDEMWAIIKQQQYDEVKGG